MTLNPFVYGSASSLKCFDEASPCTLEQTSMCVIDIAQKAAIWAQGAYVPWLVCMDSNGDPTSQCNAQVGVSDSAVNQCLGADSQLVQQYLQVDSTIHATPTVHINGKSVKTSYSAIQSAICEADPSLDGCSKAVPNGADWEAPTCVVPRDVVV